MSCPLDYSLCTQTVTLYRQENDAIICKQINNCYFQLVDRRRYDALGTVREKDFLLIVPGSVADIRPGDRMMSGVGPEIDTNNWYSFVPENVSGLVQVAYVKPCYWENEICHYEAGSK